mmetsp:Transcript_11532/g.25772  ORF Transcript_11532/g.25772 Transcript_11532/m.25772 type:complete len:204 (+) Transcript_11532:732-1343(+)
MIMVRTTFSLLGLSCFDFDEFVSHLDAARRAVVSVNVGIIVSKLEHFARNFRIAKGHKAKPTRAVSLIIKHDYRINQLSEFFKEGAEFVVSDVGGQSSNKKLARIFLERRNRQCATGVLASTPSMGRTVVVVVGSSSKRAIGGSLSIVHICIDRCTQRRGKFVGLEVCRRRWRIHPRSTSSRRWSKFLVFHNVVFHSSSLLRV